MAEWWKQLYGESEGKNGIGIFPASVEYNADLHSMGQYIQDGPRTLMETVVALRDSRRMRSPSHSRMGDPDRLNYLAGRRAQRHQPHGARTPSRPRTSPAACRIIGRCACRQRDEAGFAELVCFFELACAISGYMSGVNPFDQPGVEAYKKNMFSHARQTGGKLRKVIVAVGAKTC